jgi:hypothetical protein
MIGLTLLYNYSQLWQLTHWTPSERRLSDESVWRMSDCSPVALNEFEFYVTTDSQPANLSWNKAPIWGLQPDFYYCLTVAGLLFGTPFLTRGRVCRLQWLLAFASAVIFGTDSLWTRGHILLSQIRDFPFRRLLRLAGSRWRYSTPPPHGFSALNALPSITVTRPE